MIPLMKAGRRQKVEDESHEGRGEGSICTKSTCYEVKNGKKMDNGEFQQLPYVCWPNKSDAINVLHEEREEQSNRFQKDWNVQLNLK